jgi:hypothetical protein
MTHPEHGPEEPRTEPVVHRKQWTGWPLLALIGAAVLLIVIYVVFPSAPKMAAPAPGAQVPDQPGGNQLQLTNLRMTVSPPREREVSVKLNGNIRNVGGPAVEGATIEASFMDKTGHVAIQQAQPLERIAAQGHSGKEVELKEQPLKPNDVGAFEVEFTGILANWNQQMPEVRIVDVETNAPPQPEAANNETSKPSPAEPKYARRHKH